MICGGKRLITKFRRMKSGSKAAMMLTALLVFFLCSLIIGWFAHLLDGGLRRGEATFAVMATKGLLEWPGILFSILLFLLVTAVVLRLLTQGTDMNYSDGRGKYGERYMKNSTFGSARFMTHEESGEYYDVDPDINRHYGMVYGRLKEKKDEDQ